MAFVLCVLLAVPCDSPPQSMSEIRERLKDPAKVFDLFKCLLRHGQTGKAHNLLTPDSSRHLKPEELYLAFTSFEATRRMVLRAEAHNLRVGEKTGTFRVCNAEFGLFLELGLQKFGKVWLMKLSRDDVLSLKDRALGWFRHQKKKADGWHFAYPPDWSYAPRARTCPCKP